MKSVKVASLIE